MVKKKLYLATVASAVVASSVVPVGASAAETTFKDVSKTNSHYGAIMDLANRGIIKGFGDGTFGVEKPVTRGQTAKILVGVLGLQTDEVTTTGFSDVQATNNFAREIVALKKLGVISGFADGTFKPNDPITRNQMAIILTRALQLQTPESVKLPFTDVQETYKNEIAALYHNGITAGTTPTTFNGKSYVTRGQFASFVVRAEKVGNNGQTFTVEIIAKQAFTAGGKTYTISAAVQPFLNEVNAKALTGAKIEGKVVDGKLVSITSIEFNQSGAANAPVIFDGQKATLSGHVKVNANFVELKNVNVTGNVTLTANASTNFSASELDVQGELIVEEVTPSRTASLTLMANEVASSPLNLGLTNCYLSRVLVNRPSAIFNANRPLPLVQLGNFVGGVTFNTDITTLRLPAIPPSNFQINGRGAINAFEIMSPPSTPNVPSPTPPQLNVQWNGTIGNFIVSNPAVRIQAGPSLRITRFTAPTSINPATIFSNPTVALPNIGSFQLPDGTPVTAPTVSAPTGGGGGGGGSSQTTPPTEPEQDPPELEVVSEEAVKAVAKSVDLLRSELEVADNVYFQYGDEKYLEFELKAFEKFLPIFESEAPAAGYNLNEFKNYPINGKMKMIYSWLYYTNLTANQFNSLNSKIKSDIALFYKALEADTPTTMIAINDQESKTAQEILYGTDTLNEDMFIDYYGNIIGLDLTEFKKLKNEKETVISAVLSIEKGDESTPRFNQNKDAIQQAIDEAVNVEKIKIAEKAISYLNNSMYRENDSIQEILSSAAWALGINYNEFSSYSKTYKNAVSEVIWSKKPYENVESLRQEFETAVQKERDTFNTSLLAFVNNPTYTAENIRYKLEQEAGALGLDMYNYYRILDVVNRKNVGQVLADKRLDGYSDVATLKEAFANAVEAEINNIFENAETLGLYLEVGKASSANIVPTGTKAFKMDLTAEQLYALTSAPFPSFVSELAVYRMNGSSPERVAFYNGPSTFAFNVVNDGTYYLVFKAVDKSSSGTHVISLYEAEKLDGNTLNLGLTSNGWYGLYDDSVIVDNRQIAETAIMFGGVAVIPKKPGSTVATITTDNYEGDFKVAKLEVTIAEDGKVTFGEVTNSNYKLIENDPYILGVEAVKVSSSTEDVATVELENGQIKITPVAEGTTTIIATDSKDRQSLIEVTINENLELTTEIKAYTTKILSVTKEVVDKKNTANEEVDLLNITFSDAVSGNYYSFELNGEQIYPMPNYTQSEDDKTITFEVKDEVLATASTVTLNSVYSVDYDKYIPVGNIPIPFSANE